MDPLTGGPLLRGIQRTRREKTLGSDTATVTHRKLFTQKGHSPSLSNGLYPISYVRTVTNGPLSLLIARIIICRPNEKQITI